MMPFSPARHQSDMKENIFQHFPRHEKFCQGQKTFCTLTSNKTKSSGTVLQLSSGTKANVRVLKALHQTQKHNIQNLTPFLLSQCLRMYSDSLSIYSFKLFTEILHLHDCFYFDFIQISKNTC